ncbi:MAG TPA: 4Fe-4S binding protein [Bacteroidales bacterium]|nr:4Fe-4S binding protein [Bacteroidales bacterium]HPS17706.1 4Fe-4S binding protein [Bacteroidales bacterium]
MKRKIVHINEDLCNGCGLCIPNCQEGALQIIDGKARLISDLFCDGLGACLGHCPEGAITIEEREAEPYNEKKVMDIISKQGENTIIAHLSHLKEHNETEYYNQAINYLKEKNIKITLNMNNMEKHSSHCGCPGAKEVDMREENQKETNSFDEKIQSQLRQWPVQMHLISPNATYFKYADVLLAADCTAFAMGGFHNELMKGKAIAIACPKLDSDTEEYIEKIKAMIDDAKINTLTVAIMEVPCCGGLLKIAQMAVEKASRKVPIKLIIVNIKGEVDKEMWV